MSQPTRRPDLLTLFVAMLFAAPFVDNAVRGVTCQTYNDLEPPIMYWCGVGRPAPFARGWPVPFEQRWEDDATSFSATWLLADTAAAWFVVALNCFWFERWLRPQGSRFRFGIKTLLIAVTVVAAMLAFYRLDFTYEQMWGQLHHTFRWFDTLCWVVMWAETVAAAIIVLRLVIR